MSTGVRPAAGIEPVETFSSERARYSLMSVKLDARNEPVESIDYGSVPLRWPLPWNYASASRRLAALTVDGAIVVLLWMTELLVFTLFQWNTDGSRWELSFFLILILYGLGFTALGATPGKRLLGLRVVDREQRRPGLIRSFVRNLLPGFKWCWPILIFLLDPRFDYYLEVYQPLSVIVLLLFFGPLFVLISELAAIAEKPYRQVLHDKLAGTYVIRV